MKTLPNQRSSVDGPPMSMDKSEALEITLAGRRKARRTSSDFTLSRELCRAHGLTPQDVIDIEAAADRIEALIDAEKSGLKVRW